MVDNDLERTGSDGDGHAELFELVGEWLAVPDMVERFGLTVPEVRRMIKDRELLAARVGANRALRVPARFVDADGVPLPALKGTFTVLADGGMNDDEVITWLFTPDASLPAPGAPIDSIVAGFKTEVRRRAAELAF